MFRVILHMDMDAFYASVEQRDNPALKDKPLIVGAPPTQRGVVCAASYEAANLACVRHAQFSCQTAVSRCGLYYAAYAPLPGRIDEIMRIISLPEAVVEQISVDEAYMDISTLSQQADADSSLAHALPLAKG